MEFRYLFRKPTFPLVGSVEGHFIGAKKPKDLSSQLVKIQFIKDESFNLVDITGEGWSLYTAEMMVSPLTIKKRWTKLEIIKLFGESKNRLPVSGYLAKAQFKDHHSDHQEGDGQLGRGCHHHAQPRAETGAA